MAGLMLVNPRRRRRTTAKRRAPARRRSTLPALRRKSPRRRRNPIRGSNIADQFMGGAIGAAGALAVDVVMSKVPLPAALTGSPLIAAVTKSMIGIGLGMAVAKFGRNRSLGHKLANGAVTIGLYNAGRGMIGPQLGLSGYADQGLLGYGDEGLLGAYSDFNDVGFMSPAPVSSWGSMDGIDVFEPSF